MRLGQGTVLWARFTRYVSARNGVPICKLESRSSLHYQLELLELSSTVTRNYMQTLERTHTHICTHKHVRTHACMNICITKDAHTATEKGSTQPQSSEFLRKNFTISYNGQKMSA